MRTMYGRSIVALISNSAGPAVMSVAVPRCTPMILTSGAATDRARPRFIGGFGVKALAVSPNVVWGIGR